MGQDSCSALDAGKPTKPPFHQLTTSVREPKTRAATDDDNHVIVIVALHCTPRYAGWEEGRTMCAHSKPTPPPPANDTYAEEQQ